MRAIRWGVTLALLTLAAVAGAQVKVERVAYHGWPGAFRLINGTVDLVFVPQIGRVMRYGFLGGPNVLWENPPLAGKTFKPEVTKKEWTNFGGDKLWPAPQNHWTWPPDPYLDGSQQTVEVLPGNRLRVTTQSSKAKSIRFIREISLAAAGSGVSFRNIMENIGDQDVEWSVWEVAQVRVPEHAELVENKAGHFKSGYYVFKGYPPAPGAVRVNKGAVEFRWHKTHNGKIGSDSPAARASAVQGKQRFTVTARYEADQPYPDDGCGQEIWSNPAPESYMELELLGPIRMLQPGDKQILVTNWRLERLR